MACRVRQRECFPTSERGDLIVSATRLGYRTRDGRPVAVADWTEHGVVYICFIPGEASSHERLLKATAPTAA